MRLADKIVQSVNSASDLAGSISNVSTALQSAQRFEFDDRFTLACETLANSKPSSLTAALPLCRLPYKKVWLEWRGSALKLAEKGDYTPPSKLGCLLESQGDDLQTVSATWAWHHEEPATGGVSVCPLGAFMSWNPDKEIPDVLRELADRLQTQASPEHIAAAQAIFKLISAERLLTNSEAANLMLSGKFARHARSTEEVDAFRKIASHSMTIIPSHTEAFFSAMMNGANAATRAKLITMWRSDLSGEAAFVQCAIALLNSRNCVSHSNVDLAKLNKSRIKHRKPPLLSYSITRLDLSKTQRRVAAAGGVEVSAAQRHLVRGHPKVRKSGIYWWTPFMRGVGVTPLTRKAYTVTTS
jgi:hypothetical protein